MFGLWIQVCQSLIQIVILLHDGDWDGGGGDGDDGVMLSASRGCECLLGPGSLHS